MLIFGWNFAVDAWSRSWGCNLIKICIRTTQPSGPWCLSLSQCFKILNGSNDEKDHRAPRSVWAQHFEDDETTNDYRGRWAMVIIPLCKRASFTKLIMFIRFPRQTARFQPQTRTTRPDLEMLMVILIRMKIADSAQTEYCSTFPLSVRVSGRPCVRVSQEWHLTFLTYIKA